jgi:hypothetical protein
MLETNASQESLSDERMHDTVEGIEETVTLNGHEVSLCSFDTFDRTYIIQMQHSKLEKKALYDREIASADEWQTTYEKFLSDRCLWNDVEIVAMCDAMHDWLKMLALERLATIKTYEAAICETVKEQDAKLSATSPERKEAIELLIDTWHRL